MTHIKVCTGKTEWYTPLKYIELAKQVLETIDLDPCSSEIANRLVKAKTYYTAEQNGLQQKWFGNVWCNPPYAKGIIEEWTTHFIDRYYQEEFKQGIILTDAATETRWGQNLLHSCTAYCFPNHRIKFLQPSGGALGSPPRPQMFCYFGSDHVVFQQVFEDIGYTNDNLF